MYKTESKFSQKNVTSYFNADFSAINQLTGDARIILLSDENLIQHYADKFQPYPVISIPAGELNKTQASVDLIIDQLIKLEADRKTLLIGVGGGVVTDIAGYVASVFMRGIKCALVPTSILAMVDAAIGGKNGVDVGIYKNMVGTIRQPDFIFYDYSFLDTLPVNEWINGFAEIIKHACIKDELMFSMLQKYSLHDYQLDRTLVAELIERNASLKSSIVVNDEFETGERKLLNFGHTIGHAIENLHGIPHGHAVSIGMVAACNLSEKINNLHFTEATKLVKLLNQYLLPVDVETDYDKVFDVLKMDKKRKDDGIQFVLLNKIGQAQIKFIKLDLLKQYFKEIF